MSEPRMMMPHDLRRVVRRLANETLQIVDSGLVRKEFKKRKILTGERSEGPQSWNGKQFSDADSKECQSLRLLRWKHGRTIGWSMPPKTQSAARALYDYAAANGWTRNHATPRSADIDLGLNVAGIVARWINKSMHLPEGWAYPAFFKFNTPDKDCLQYGSFPVFELDGRLSFDVWLDRATNSDKETPILCVAFAAKRAADCAALRDVCIAEGVQPIEYYQEAPTRYSGFDGVPVLEVPSNPASYLTCYQPAGEFDIDSACKRFRAFFLEWQGKLQVLPKLSRKRRKPQDRTMLVLRGLVGELVVLAALGDDAEWVGPQGGLYDIVYGDFSIEVKTRTQDEATVSIWQIRASQDPLYLFATVDISAEAAAILWQCDHAEQLHPVMSRNRDAINTLLAENGITSTPELLAAISASILDVSGETKNITYCRMQVPSGFEEAVQNLEAHGAIAQLSVRCGHDWFVTCDPSR